MQVIRLLVVLCVMSIVVTASYANAEIKSFTKEYTYQASELDSKATCRIIALEQVKRILLEELGMYLESKTEVKNSELTLDQITTLTAGIVSTKVVGEKWDGATYYLKANISADPDEVAKSVDKLHKDAQKSKELEESRSLAKKYAKEIERLKETLEVTKAKPNKKQNKSQMIEYQKAVDLLSASDFFEKAYLFQSNGKYKEAIEQYTEAIHKNPKYDLAYLNRGSAYSQLGNHQKEIEDYSKAININPAFVEAYNYRCIAHSNSKNQKLAIEDCNMAIKLNPEYADAYNNRGAAYFDLGDIQRAKEDFSKCIELNPKYARAYFNRGKTYVRLNKVEIGTVDTLMAAILGHKEAQGVLDENHIRRYASNNSDTIISQDQTNQTGSSLVDFFQLLKEESEHGNAAAQIGLAKMYLAGIGVDKNKHQAERYLVFSLLNQPRDKDAIVLFEKELGWHCLRESENEECILYVNKDSIVSINKLVWYWNYVIRKSKQNNETIVAIIKNNDALNCDNRTQASKVMNFLDSNLMPRKGLSFTVKDSEMEFKPLEPDNQTKQLINYLCKAH